jgi:hypothetical protein
MCDDADKWREAQASVLMEEYRVATGKAAESPQDLEVWFASLSPDEKKRLGGRMNDDKIVGWHRSKQERKKGRP